MKYTKKSNVVKCEDMKGFLDSSSDDEHLPLKLVLIVGILEDEE